MNYYNEFDPFAAAWLRELIKAKLIPQGEVDERSITEVQPSDLKGYTQCHFFAGIGGWSYALQLARWPADRPVWTGSCPCQPFSSAGNRKGKTDERHLWPIWLNLIRECSPPTIFGEQVSSAIAHGWLDDVYQGLEAEGYACGAAVLPACGVGAPHKRDRLWFVADTTGRGRDAQPLPYASSVSGENYFDVKQSGEVGNVGNAEHTRPHGGQVKGSNGQAISDNTQGEDGSCKFEGTSKSCDVANASSEGSQGHWQFRKQPIQEMRQGKERHPWAIGVWINCPDGKQRLIEPSIPLLANGIQNRVGRLRGYGNAIVPQTAAEFIGAFMDRQ